MNMRLIAQSGTFIVTKQVGTPIEDIVVAYKDPKEPSSNLNYLQSWSGHLVCGHSL